MSLSPRSELTDGVADCNPSMDQALWQLARTGENGPIHLTYWTDGGERQLRKKQNPTANPLPQMYTVYYRSTLPRNVLFLDYLW